MRSHAEKMLARAVFLGILCGEQPIGRRSLLRYRRLILLIFLPLLWDGTMLLPLMAQSEARWYKTKMRGMAMTAAPRMTRFAP